MKDFSDFLQYISPNPEVKTPNMRFGTSFLSFDKHEHAVKDEVLMDKRTGQLVYKRDTDGKLIYYAQENFHLNNYIRQLKALMTKYRRNYERPTVNNCTCYPDTYFVSYNIEMIDFFFTDDDTEKSLLNGSVLMNKYPEEHNITLEQNGFFVNLTGRPRDRALISFLTAIYDKHYKYYVGEDEESLTKKEYYKLPTYDMSQAVVNYTVTYYDNRGNVYAGGMPTNGYVRVNEVSFIPFNDWVTYDRDTVSYATLRINSISTPKLAEAARLLATANERKILSMVTDNEDISFMSCNISAFMTTTDKDFILPTDKNCIPMLVMGFEEFETELINAKEGGGASGIIVSVEQPDMIDWEDATLWFELVRKVYIPGEEDPTGAETDIEDLENGFGMIEWFHTKFTQNASETEHFLIQKEEE